MNLTRTIPLVAGLLMTAGSTLAEPEVPVKLPEFKPGQYVHRAPTVEDLMADESIHPELKKVILKGRDMFMNTQQFRGKYVFNDMNCKSCHIGEGRMNWSGPIWPAATTLPDFRDKNQHVNSLEERIVDCFSYSMNGKPPEYGSDDMLALVAYHQWLAKGARVYEKNIGGRGFNHLGQKKPKLDYERGKAVYQAQCAICHGEDGQGKTVDGQVVFPPLWGDRSYNWGAGIARIFTAASFIKNNMPLGKPGSLTDEEAWQVANYINSQERPQDPRYTGDVKETREKYLDTFHKHTNYGTVVNGKLLGDHNNTGEKPFLKPEILRP